MWFDSKKQPNLIKFCAYSYIIVTVYEILNQNSYTLKLTEMHKCAWIQQKALASTKNKPMSGVTSHAKKESTSWLE